MSEPRKTLDWNKIDRMLEAQCTGTEIAAALGVHRDTLYDRVKEKYNMSYSDYSASKHSHGLGILKTMQFQKALNNNSQGNTQMLIWLGKVLLNQKEPQNITQSYTEQEIKQIEKVIEMIDARNGIPSSTEAT